MLASCYKSNAHPVGPEKNNIIETMDMMDEKRNNIIETMDMMKEWKWWLNKMKKMKRNPIGVGAYDTISTYRVL